MNSKQAAQMTRESIERDKKAARRRLELEKANEREARRRLELAKELQDAIGQAAAQGNWGCVVEVLGYPDDVNYVVRVLQYRGFVVSVSLLPGSDVTDPNRCRVAITWTEEGDARGDD